MEWGGVQVCTITEYGLKRWFSVWNTLDVVTCEVPISSAPLISPHHTTSTSTPVLCLYRS